MRTVSAMLALTALLFSAGAHAEQQSSSAEVLHCRTMFRVGSVDADDFLSLRRGPSLEAPVLLGIPADAIDIEDMAQKVGRWRRVRYAGREGHVDERYLRPYAICNSRSPTFGPAEGRPKLSVSN